MKRCSKCERWKKLSEFYKNKNMKDGYNTWCKNCCNSYQKQYRQDHLEERNKYCQENRKKLLKQHKKYNETHKKQDKEYRKKISRL